MSRAAKYSPRDTSSSALMPFSILARSASNSRPSGVDRPSASRISKYRLRTISNTPSQLTPYCRWAWHRYSRSVILWSFLNRFPAALTTTTRRPGSASTMERTLANWVSSAMDEPPNFNTFNIRLASFAVIFREGFSSRRQKISFCLREKNTCFFVGDSVS